MATRLASDSSKKKEKPSTSNPAKIMSPNTVTQLIDSRTYSFIESDSLEQGHAHEALLRAEDGTFLLYVAEHIGCARTSARFVNIEARDALIWINQPADGLGPFWD